MKFFQTYDSPSFAARLIMAAGDLLSRLLVPVRVKPHLPLQREQASKVLLLRLDGIGDNICSWPALELLREKLPNTHITLAVGPWAVSLYHECPWIDEIIVWDSGLFGLFRSKGISGLTHDLRMTRQLRQQNFDVGIDLRGDLLSIVLLWLTAPPIRIGSIMRGGARMLTDPLHISDGHEIDRTLSVAGKTLGIAVEKSSGIPDWPRPIARSRVLEQLSAVGLNIERPMVALCPGALWFWKQWPHERFLELAKRLETSLGLQVIWIIETEQQQKYSGVGLCYTGELDKVAAVLGICRLAVCSDSGLLHLSVAAGCSTIQLFGPGDADRFAHTGQRLKLFHDRSCKRYPCVQRGTCENLGNGWCLDKISVDDVFAACQLLSAEYADFVNFHRVKI